MNNDSFRQLFGDIVNRANELKNAHTNQKNAVVNYSCVFSHSEQEYKLLAVEVAKMGKVVKESKMGNVYQLYDQIQTVAGPLDIIKIRKPDPSRPEQGDADFTVADYDTFKMQHLGQPGFKLIMRPEMEMIELKDSKFDVLAYFSHPTLAEVIGVTNL